MDADALIDRRRLRRKLAFWRAGTIVIALVALGAAIYWASPGRTASPHIARIEIKGMIEDDDELIETIDAAAQSPAAKAIVVSLATPGGTTYGGERIHRALVKAQEKKPVVAQVRTLAASAGYMIAASTDHIVAGESSIVGSIGVLFQYPQVGELLNELGVEVNTIKSSPLKAEPSPFHPTSPEAEAMIRSMVMDSYDWFVDLVATQREIDRSRVLQLADGSIFTGRQALDNGLVDALGGEAEIRAYLKERGVDDTLAFVEWEPKSAERETLVPLIVGLALDRLTGGRFDLAARIEQLGGGKLFLDGLVSVWQAAPQSQSR